MHRAALPREPASASRNSGPPRRVPWPSSRLARVELPRPPAHRKTVSTPCRRPERVARLLHPDPHADPEAVELLAWLAFALEHAAQHRQHHIIVVIPFTAVVDETAQVYRHAFRLRSSCPGTWCSFDWPAVQRPGTTMPAMVDEQLQRPGVIAAGTGFVRSSSPRRSQSLESLYADPRLAPVPRAASLR